MDPPIYLDYAARRAGRTEPPADPIYLDYNATTPVDPAVADAMRRTSASSGGIRRVRTRYGKAAPRRGREGARQVAGLDRRTPTRSSSPAAGPRRATTRSRALTSAAFARAPVGRQLITTAVEHPATRQASSSSRGSGSRRSSSRSTYGLVDPDGDGSAPEAARGSSASCTRTTRSAPSCRSRRSRARAVEGALVHTTLRSRSARCGRCRALGVDFLTIAGHKLYAPKGVGALYVRRGVQLEPLRSTAPATNGRRAGTENVPYIVGLGKAAEIARESLPRDRASAVAPRPAGHRAGPRRRSCSTATRRSGCRTR